MYISCVFTIYMASCSFRTGLPIIPLTITKSKPSALYLSFFKLNIYYLIYSIQLTMSTLNALSYYIDYFAFDLGSYS